MELRSVVFSSIINLSIVSWPCSEQLQSVIYRAKARLNAAPDGRYRNLSTCESSRMYVLVEYLSTGSHPEKAITRNRYVIR